MRAEACACSTGTEAVPALSIVLQPGIIPEIPGIIHQPLKVPQILFAICVLGPLVAR